MKEVKYNNLSAVKQVLLICADAAKEKAYNPYSHFYVGAAIMDKNGNVITGANVENAAYGSTICAERAAILHANARGLRLFESIAIIARGETFDTQTVTAPCGSCRQMLYESSQLAESDLEVIMSTTKKDKIIIATISELLPLAFGPKDVGVDVQKYK